jgi:SWIM zinc finger
MDTTESSAPAHPSTREQRGLELYRERGDEIQLLGENTFGVPSCTGRGLYEVRYGGDVESCSCPDYEFGHTCKHLLAVGIAHASRRSGIREIRVLATVAGDPFAHAGKLPPCVGCGGRFGWREMVECGEDNHDGLTYFDGDPLCQTCANAASVEY